ncbi:4-hydroxythreonine-4-phosphate dehydrogenase PdxA [Treponema primitia]|uniref:4-hydroxythreonine-4-phosphate dehydrogenase PdxA n=1 Tax=Treponema primitia TaxID=88058 RepID=UPI000255573B|nr:4-hydroxythreonine-4-phosphate dehydrogenase PdxA [Treponema primitia]
MSKKPILGITMGDPSGCGPEITIKALGQKKIYEVCKPLVVGDARVLEKAAREAIKRQDLVIHPVSSVGECLFTYGTIDVFDLHNVELDKLKIGKVDAMSGDAAFTSVKKVIELALAGDIDATITNPLNKEALNLAGHHYSGHTEIYADLTKTKDYSMMLADDALRVVHVSTHVSLREACDRVKKDRVLKVIELAHTTCKSLGIENPRIAVAGLNPHAGENGMFGREEIDEIIPAIEAAKTKGINADGPIPPDTVFAKAHGGLYDIVVAMYHDQGHIPLKVLGFQYDKTAEKWQAVNGVNITLGLPIIRSSVDHGTAFGHAWQGSANESSLVNAIEYGITLAVNKK